MNHIINVRGTNGSGKTTTVRTLMNYLTHYKDATTSNGVFFHVYTTPAGEYVAFIGKYEGAVTGGVDRVRSVRDVVEACREIIPYAHIVMEGLLMSGLQQLTKDIADACVGDGQFHALTLDTPKEKCIAQTLNRRALAGNAAVRVFGRRRRGPSVPPEPEDSRREWPNRGTPPARKRAFGGRCGAR